MINLAMIGLGWWGKKMVAVLQNGSELARIVHGVDPALAEARDFAADYGFPISASLDAAIADPNVDALVLATPHALHAEQILAAVAARKHVFCEKPLALTRAGAEAAVLACRDAGLVLGLGHERRFEPPVAALLGDAKAGRLGRIVQIEANFSHDKFLTLDPSNWRLDPRQAPAGGMTATGVHLTDLAIALMGPAREVLVTSEQLASAMPSGDTMSAYLRFTGGGTAYIAASLSYPFIFRFAAYGTGGWVEIRDIAHVENPQGWVVTKGFSGQSIIVETVEKSDPVLKNLEAFCRAILGDLPYPISDADKVDNIALLEAIITSSTTGEVVRVQ